VRPLCSFGAFPNAVIATAIHSGHDLRPAIAARSALDDATRLREEDPYTDRLTAVGGATVVVHRSRFEVDLNRPRAQAVYRAPEDAWGLDLWERSPSEHDVAQSLQLHDEFYSEFGNRLDDVAENGSFVVLDVHSYNHRRDGADAPPAAEATNPEVNVGTGSLDRQRWGAIADRFIDELSQRKVLDHLLDVRENIRFRGGELSRWVNARYAGRGCALAIEFKKTFMDEWTGVVDDDHTEQLRRAVAATVPSLTETLRRSVTT
jgi:N-formylglutamate amidohydrolase